MVMRVRVMEA